MDIFKKEIDWRNATKEIQKQIDNDLDASNALRKLVRLGCDKTAILRRLYMYCGGSPGDAAKAKKEFLWRKKHLLSLSKRLKMESIPAIERANTYLADAGLFVASPVVEVIKSHSEILERLGSTVFKDLASGRIGARGHHLVFMVKLIERLAGNPHYTELSKLINAVQPINCEEPRSLTPDALRLRVERSLPLDLDSTYQLEELTKDSRKSIEQTADSERGKISKRKFRAK